MLRLWSSKVLYTILCTLVVDGLGEKIPSRRRKRRRMRSNLHNLCAAINTTLTWSSPAACLSPSILHLSGETELCVVGSAGRLLIMHTPACAGGGGVYELKRATRR